jgi:hypothetical protein
MSPQKTIAAGLNVRVSTNSSVLTTLLVAVRTLQNTCYFVHHSHQSVQ